MLTLICQGAHTLAMLLLPRPVHRPRLSPEIEALAREYYPDGWLMRPERVLAMSNEMARWGHGQASYMTGLMMQIAELSVLCAEADRRGIPYQRVPEDQIAAARRKFRL